MPIPADVAPYIIEAIKISRNQQTKFQALVDGSTAQDSAEEIAYWQAQADLYEATLNELVTTLEIQ